MHRKPGTPALAAFVIVALFASPAWACPYCTQRPLVWAGVFDENFVRTLLQVGLSVPLLIAVGLAFHLVDRWPFRSTAQPTEAGPGDLAHVRRGPFLSAGVTMGIGLGGFLDGIVLHMLMQWHNLIAERVPPVDFVTLEINMFWDGVFNLGMWLITVVGLWFLWRASRPPNGLWSGKTLIGALIVGWGVFQVADGILFHWVYELHHIKQGAPDWLFWDLAYFIMGLALMGVGLGIIRCDRHGRAIDLGATATGQIDARKR